MSSRRVVLITGCSTGGIGYSLCEEFARLGCKVYATSRNKDTIEDFKDPQVERRMLDVRSDEDVERVVHEILDTEGRIDILINNAGVLGVGPLIDQTLERTKQVFDTNTFSALRLAKAVIPSMAKRKAGLIINIGSIMGETPGPWNGLYSASKAALHNMTEVLSMECKPFNINVMLVSPGGVKSKISDNQASIFSLPFDSLYSDYLEFIIKRIHISQSRSPITSEAFAVQVANKAMRERPPTYMTLGGDSRLFSFLKWIPRSWALNLLWRQFSRR